MKSCMSDLSSLRTGGPRCEGPSSNPGLTACIAKGVAICPPHSWVAMAARYQELGFHQARCGIGFPHACCHTTAHELWLLAASAPSGCAHRCTSPGQSRVGLQGCEDIMHKISKANVHSMHGHSSFEKGNSQMVCASHLANEEPQGDPQTNGLHILALGFILTSRTHTNLTTCKMALQLLLWRGKPLGKPTTQ